MDIFCRTARRKRRELGVLFAGLYEVARVDAFQPCNILLYTPSWCASGKLTRPCISSTSVIQNPKHRADRAVADQAVTWNVIVAVETSVWEVSARKEIPAKAVT